MSPQRFEVLLPTCQGADPTVISYFKDFLSCALGARGLKDKENGYIEHEESFKQEGIKAIISSINLPAKHCCEKQADDVAVALGFCESNVFLCNLNKLYI